MIFSKNFVDQRNDRVGFSTDTMTFSLIAVATNIAVLM